MKFDENQALQNTLRRSEKARASMLRKMTFAVLVSLCIGGWIGAGIMYYFGGC